MEVEFPILKGKVRIPRYNRDKNCQTRAFLDAEGNGSVIDSSFLSPESESIEKDPEDIIPTAIKEGDKYCQICDFRSTPESIK